MALSTVLSPILNEVLSLNAQEYAKGPYSQVKEWFLNEVLSLNAQEFRKKLLEIWRNVILNEVLSLNAQEFALGHGVAEVARSSMKS